MEAEHLREHIIRPTLLGMGKVIPYSEEAEDILCMTAAHESNCGQYVRQLGMEGDEGAFGIYQHELASIKDMYDNYLVFKQDIQEELNDYIIPDIDSKLQVMGNLLLATALARVHYYRVPHPLPKKDAFEEHAQYLEALSKYCKKYFNTEEGKATEHDYFNAYMHHFGELDE